MHPFAPETWGWDDHDGEEALVREIHSTAACDVRCTLPMMRLLCSPRLYALECLLFFWEDGTSLFYSLAAVHRMMALERTGMPSLWFV